MSKHTKIHTVRSLEDLAACQGANKQEKQHGYTRYYERHFAPVRDQVVSLLEIGVGEGASLRLWSRYFTTAIVWGVDCESDAAVHACGRIRVRIGNQDDETFLARVAMEAGGFDIIIDSGGFKMAQQRRSFCILWPHMYPGGLYVVEGLHTSYWKEHCDCNLTMVQWLKALVDDVNIRGKMGWANKHRNVVEIEGLSAFEKEIEAIHFYPGLVFVQKMP